MGLEKPVYLLAGGRPRGNRSPDLIMKTILEENGLTSPTVAYIGVANGDDSRFFQFMSENLREAGAGKINHVILCSHSVDIKKAQDTLKSADIIHISGGDVEAGMQVLTEKKMIDFLTSLYKQGKPFFGVSAGSIMLAKEWIRWPDPDDDNSAEIFPCLGFASVLCDTHGEGDGWEELQALLKMEPENTRGYGIVSGMAIKVFPDGRVEAFGGAVNRYLRQSGKVKEIPDIIPVKK
jgi:peptidase E